MAQAQQRDYREFGRLIESGVTAGPQFELYLPDHIQTVFAEGVGAVSIGPNVARVPLYRIVHVEYQPTFKEIRQLSTVLNLPAASFVEMSVNALKSLKNFPDLEYRLTLGPRNILQQLEKISISE